MNVLLAAATNELTSGSTAEKISVGLNGWGVVWAIGFTLLWDVIDLWIRYRRFQFVGTSAFFLYALFHVGISILATIVLSKTFNDPWLIGLFAAVGNEMVLSNANITFGKAPILPLLDKFRELRAAMQEEIDAIKKSQRRELIEKLAGKLQLAGLKIKVQTLLVQEGKQVSEITKLLADLEADCKGDQKILATKLANDFIQLDPVGANAAAKEA